MQDIYSRKRKEKIPKWFWIVVAIIIISVISVIPIRDLIIGIIFLIIIYLIEKDNWFRNI